MTPRKKLVATVVAATLLVSWLVPGLVAAPAAEAQTPNFTFRGRGWGHGIGLSQWGARGLAAKGKTASSILKTYYTGTVVEKKSLPSKIRVGLLQERAEIWVEGDARFDLHDAAGTRKASGKAGERWRIVPDGTALEVFSPDSDTKPVFRSTEPVSVRYELHGTKVKLPQTGYSYRRGRIDVDLNETTKKTRAVLIVPFEQYLYGLGEMPSSWPVEALEAQAIAGRTYALEKINRLGQQRSVCNCAVYATTADQAYVGTAHEVDRWVDAVETTAGLVVTHRDKPIQAYYSSSSGGHTENNENVFGGTALPYLRGVCDPGDYFDGENPHNNWTVTMDGADVGAKMSDAGHETGPVQDIDYLSPRGVSGRLIPIKDATTGGVRVEGTLSDVRLSGGTFRSILGLKTTLIHHHITGAIRERYDSIKCSPGLPTGGEYAWKDLDGATTGRAQNFKNARLILNSVAAKVFSVKGQILAHYDAGRADGLDLGPPTSDQLAVTGGVLTTFARGRIYYSSKTSAHEVHGAILSKYLKTGGHKKWGLPMTDEQRVADGRTNRFVKARIYWSPDHGAHVVYGAIFGRYQDLGGASGKLGFPISDEYKVSGGRRQDFENGYIKWNSETGKTSYKIT